MKAIVQESYGAPQEVLAFDDIAGPVVGEDDVLVRVQAASVNPADWHIIRGDPYLARLSFGLRGPKEPVPGCDLAGRVEAVGSAVTAFAPGDEVFGSAFMRGLGAFAEWASVPHDVLAAKPANLSFEHAAALPVGALTALQGLRDQGRVEPGQKVLIVGASGGVGTFAVQIAKSLGAEVTGVCSTRNVEMVRSIGADQVIDYTEEDFTHSGRRYDLIFQLAGTRSPSDCRRALTPKGTLLLSSGESKGHWIGPVGRIVKALALSPFVGQTLVSFLVKPNGEDLHTLKELVEGRKVSPVIDTSYPLSEVPDAIRRLEEEHTRGKIIIAV